MPDDLTARNAARLLEPEAPAALDDPAAGAVAVTRPARPGDVDGSPASAPASVADEIGRLRATPAPLTPALTRGRRR